MSWGALYAEHQYAARLLEVLEDQIGVAPRGKPLTAKRRSPS